MLDVREEGGEGWGLEVGVAEEEEKEEGGGVEASEMWGRVEDVGGFEYPVEGGDPFWDFEGL